MKNVRAGGKKKILQMVAVLFILLLIPGCGPAAQRAGEDLPISCDVVVLGKTIAALTAALEASRQGAQVLVLAETVCLEQELLAEGAVAVLKDPSPEEENGYDLKQALLGSAGGAGQGWFFDLLRANANRDLEWFSREAEVRFVPQPPGRYCLAHPAADEASRNLAEAAAGSGVQFIEQVTVEGLEENESPPSFTMRVKLGSGLAKKILARAVILADGGYLNCPVLLKTYAPSVEPAPWRLSGTGKGVQLARELHLDLVQLDHFSYTLGRQQDDRWTKAATPDEALLVAGQKLIAVSEIGSDQVVAVLLEEKVTEGYLVVADDRLSAAERRKLQWPGHTGIDSFIEYYHLDCPDLKRRFQRRPESVYRGTRIKVLAKYCLGGVAVTGSGQALRRGAPIPGLFAAGEITGGLHGRSLLPGAALTEALVMGRQAGLNAATWARR